MDLNAEIRAELGRQRLTYADLAERLDTTRQSVQRKLTGSRSVTSVDLFEISAALGIEASELVRRAEESDISHGPATVIARGQ